MKDIQSFVSRKYNDPVYTAQGNDVFEKDGTFFVSLSFRQETSLGEGTDPKNISQYPLEDILERYSVWVSDFYEKTNGKSKDTCYLEFAGATKETIIALREIIGKHVYNKTVEENGVMVQILIIE